MNLEQVLEEIKANLTGDPLKDGPYLKSQADKYKTADFSAELERQMADMLVEITEKDYKTTLYSFLEQENKKVDEQLENIQKRFNNRNFTSGIKSLEEIISTNAPAWHDTTKYTYKCFGTPLEYLLFKALYQNETREIKPVCCDLSRVYRLYCHGLYKKSRYHEAESAIERAIELNPCDPENYIQKAELSKLTHNSTALLESAKMLLQTAISKKQVGQAYFSYSFYYSEQKQFDKALALLQMSKVFRDSPLFESELEYIKAGLGVTGDPVFYNRNELMNILISESIQPGPSATVVAAANEVAKTLESQNELNYAKYFYEIVYELTESDKINDKIAELEKNIKKRK